MNVSREKLHTFFSTISPKSNALDVFHKTISFLEAEFGSEFTETGKAALRNSIDYQFRAFATEYQAVSRKFDRIKNRFKNTWSDTVLTVERRWLLCNNESLPCTSASVLTQSKKPRGRPNKSVAELSKSSKYERAKKLANDYENNIEIILRGLKIAALNNNNTHLSELVDCIKKNLHTLDDYIFAKKSEIKKVQRMNPLSALGIVLDYKLSKNSYHGLRLNALQYDCDLYPPYNLVRETKTVCRPTTMEFTDKKASTELKDLSVHTASRILKVKEEYLVQLVKENMINIIEAEMIISYGGDGTTGQSMYHQQTSDGAEFDDHSLFVTSLTPLVLNSKKYGVIWRSPSAQSVRFNRPLSIEFAKETKSNVVEIFRKLKQQADAMEEETVTFTCANIPILVKFKFYPTLIDGKIFNTLTSTSSQSCPMCESKPTEFMSIDNITNGKFTIKEGRTLFGIQPLHAVINTFNGLLHIAYKNDVRSWRSTKVTKENIKIKKEVILKSLEREFAIKFDRPKSGGSGTTTTGQVCRKVFAHPERLAKTLGINEELVVNLATVLNVLLSQSEIKEKEKFNELCIKTYKLFVSQYGWYNMPATIHKILIHSKDVITVLPLSPGTFSEEVAESNNKYYRFNRLHHARKTSRKDNLKDVFCR